MTQYIPFNEQDYQDQNTKNTILLQHLTRHAPNQTLTFYLDDVLIENELSNLLGTIYRYNEDLKNRTYTISVSDKTAKDTPYPDKDLTYHVIEDVLIEEEDTADHLAGAE